MPRPCQTSVGAERPHKILSWARKTLAPVQRHPTEARRTCFFCDPCPMDFFSDHPAGSCHVVLGPQTMALSCGNKSSWRGSAMRIPYGSNSLAALWLLQRSPKNNRRHTLRRRRHTEHSLRRSRSRTTRPDQPGFTTRYKAEKHRSYGIDWSDEHLRCLEPTRG